jgi:lipopolysaccharide/colanic/teichoic acid biosynthesis glycosyltransferase
MNNHIFSKKQIMYLKFKRLLDIFFALFLLAFTLPILAIAIILVKLESKGPVIYKQKRPGKNKKIFTLYKVRTMKVEVEKNGVFLNDSQRKTRVGQLLRKTSIDELPQLFNVLKGEMSLIGPRPFLINDINLYTSIQEIRFLILPGITSWTAINGRNNLSFQDKCNLEVYYVKNISLGIDVLIFFKTILTVLSLKNIDDKINPLRIGGKINETEN